MEGGGEAKLTEVEEAWQEEAIAGRGIMREEECGSQGENKWESGIDIQRGIWGEEWEIK